MDISEAFERVSKEYGAAKKETFGGHTLAKFIRRDIPDQIKALIGATSDSYLIRGSAGQGQWSDSPWVAILDPVVTESPERGYYPVFLFGPNFDGFSLVMGQGTYSVREEFKKRGPEILQIRSDILRSRVPEYSAKFTTGPFEVISSKHAGGDWSTASVWGKKYSFRAPPSDAEIRGDILDMLRLYRLTSARNGYDLTDDDGADKAPIRSTDPADQAEGERRLRFHQRIERRRNGKLAQAAKRHHGYVCQGCGFDFFRVYGQLGADYIDAHHLVPLASLTDEGPILLNPKDDFAVLCANCHRIIHKMGCPTLGEFRAIINSQIPDFYNELCKTPAGSGSDADPS